MRGTKQVEGDKVESKCIFYGDLQSILVRAQVAVGVMYVNAILTIKYKT